jgi:hypothetical protein
MRLLGSMRWRPPPRARVAGSGATNWPKQVPRIPRPVFSPYEQYAVGATLVRETPSWNKIAWVLVYLIGQKPTCPRLRRSTPSFRDFGRQVAECRAYAWPEECPQLVGPTSIGLATDGGCELEGEPRALIQQGLRPRVDLRVMTPPACVSHSDNSGD